MSIGTLVDSLRLARKKVPQAALNLPGMRVLELKYARIRCLDTGGDGRPVVIAPDPPNTIEHHLAMVRDLRSSHRVIVFDMPGFGFSYPKREFSFGLNDQRDVIIDILDTLDLTDATLVFSCLASFPALAAANLRPNRVADLVLAQAPSFTDARDWANRMDKQHILGTPIIGQLMMAANGAKVADGWYRVALPKGSDTNDFLKPAQTMLKAGGCYCLASAFQRFHHADITTSSDVAQPVTVFWGAADRTHRPSNPEGILDHVPHANVHILEHCGHFPDLEYTAELITAIQK